MKISRNAYAIQEILQLLRHFWNCLISAIPYDRDKLVIKSKKISIEAKLTTVKGQSTLAFKEDIVSKIKQEFNYLKNN